MQGRENLFQLAHVLGVNAFGVIALEKLAQSLMFEALDPAAR